MGDRRGLGRGPFVVLGLVLVGALSLIVWHFLPQNPRVASIRVLERLAGAMGRGDATAMMQLVVLPPSLSRLTEPEQHRQVHEALRDEVTPEGLARLTREGKFGRALEVFPEEIGRWASNSGVNPTNCVAWRMGEGPLRAEVVLYPEKPPFRLIRCNNVFVTNHE